MKKKLILFPFIAACIYFSLSSYSAGPAITGSINGTGATGVTGCSCHNPSASAGTAVLLQLYDAAGVTLITGGYAGGTTYKIKISGTQSNTALNAFGFQLAVVRVAGAGTGSAVNAGIMSAAPSGTHLHTLSGINILEHYNGGAYAAIPGTLSGGVQNYTETITWTAPVAGTGSVRVYGTINAVDGSFTAGPPDAWNNATLTITEAAPAVAPITGTTTVCVSATTQLSNATPGGTWSSASPGVATVNTAGLVTGISAGTAVISYNTTAGTATATVTVNPLPNAGTITGPATVCAGITISLANAASGGTWTSSNNSIATVNASGTVTGVSAGAVNITYSVTNSCGTDFDIHAVTVNPAPNAGTITSGSSSICVGSTTAFSDAATGGVWSSSNTSFATVTGSGTVTGVAAGSITLSYSVTNSCGTAVATRAVSITTVASAGTITGPTVVCTGNTITLSNGVTGGTWSSDNVAVATVTPSTGIVSGVTTGAIVINYVVSSACGTATASVTITVDPAPVAGAISGAGSVCVGATIPLSASTSGGVWSSSNSTLATVDAGGVVSGVAGGTPVISYTVTGSCGSVSAVHTVTVNTLPNAGIITGPDSVCFGANIQLSSSVSGGTWSAANTKATVSATGLVQGIALGLDTIIYTVANACGSSQATKVIEIGAWPICEGTVSSVTGASHGIHLYPNPGTGLFTIDLPETGESVTITVTDIAGRTVETRSIKPGIKQAVFDLTNMPAGSYLVKVNVDGTLYREKILLR